MGKLAITGGKPVRTKTFADWPIYNRKEERALQQVLASRQDIDDIADAVEKVCANVDELRGLKHPAIEKGAMSRVERPRIEKRQY